MQTIDFYKYKCKSKIISKCPRCNANLSYIQTSVDGCASILAHLVCPQKHFAIQFAISTAFDFDKKIINLEERPIIANIQIDTYYVVIDFSDNKSLIQKMHICKFPTRERPTIRFETIAEINTLIPMDITLQRLVKLLPFS